MLPLQYMSKKYLAFLCLISANFYTLAQPCHLAFTLERMTSINQRIDERLRNILDISSAQAELSYQLSKSNSPNYTSAQVDAEQIAVVADSINYLALAAQNAETLLHIRYGMVDKQDKEYVNKVVAVAFTGLLQLSDRRTESLNKSISRLQSPGAIFETAQMRDILQNIARDLQACRRSRGKSER